MRYGTTCHAAFLIIMVTVDGKYATAREVFRELRHASLGVDNYFAQQQGIRCMTHAVGHFFNPLLFYLVFSEYRSKIQRFDVLRHGDDGEKPGNGTNKQAHSEIALQRMKRICPKKVLWLLAMVVAACTNAQQDYQAAVMAYRDSVNVVFGDTATSILPDSVLLHFHGLDYFPINAEYRVTARFRKIENAEARAMKTSGARTPLYQPYGTLHFKLKEKKCVLTLYRYADPQRPYLANHLLLAFTDQTTGQTTYGGGRYLEYTTDDVQKKMVVDFNYCFNPYCAYTTGYSCVIPPSENYLDIKVEAGVRKFHD
jgi:uncharacterized protein